MLRTCGHAVSNYVALHVISRHSRETAMCEGAERTPSESNVYKGAISSVGRAPVTKSKKASFVTMNVAR